MRRDYNYKFLGNLFVDYIQTYEKFYLEAKKVE